MYFKLLTNIRLTLISVYKNIKQSYIKYRYREYWNASNYQIKDVV